MFAQISNWIELNFWQLAVHALSKARPLSNHITKAVGFAEAHRFVETQHSFEPRPLPRVKLNQGVIALGGWLLGLVIGFLFAIR